MYMWYICWEYMYVCTKNIRVSTCYYMYLSACYLPMSISMSAYVMMRMIESTFMSIIYQWSQFVIWNQEYQLDMYFRQKWQDPRLNFELWNYHSEETTIDHTVINKVWTPDTFFPNEKDGRIHDVSCFNILCNLV